MKNTYKFTLLIASLMLLVVAATTIGVSYAIWTSPDGSGAGGEKNVTPTVTPSQNYVWAKYFGYEIVDKEAKTVAVTEFYMDKFNNESVGAGINLQDVYIPNEIWEKENGDRIFTIEEKNALEKNGEKCVTYTVTEISNRVFKDSTLKELPVTVHIPQSVTKVDTGAFVALPNLEKVIFYNNQVVIVEFGAFVNCPKLTTIQKGSNEINLVDGALVGCGTNEVS